MYHFKKALDHPPPNFTIDVSVFNKHLYLTLIFNIWQIVFSRIWYLISHVGLVLECSHGYCWAMPPLIVNWECNQEPVQCSPVVVRFTGRSVVMAKKLQIAVFTDEPSIGLQRPEGFPEDKFKNPWYVIFDRTWLTYNNTRYHLKSNCNLLPKHSRAKSETFWVFLVKTLQSQI